MKARILPLVAMLTALSACGWGSGDPTPVVDALIGQPTPFSERARIPEAQPDEALLQSILDVTSVRVLPPYGVPPASATVLQHRVAAESQKRDLPALAGGTAQSADRLTGTASARMEGTDAVYEILWRLTRPDGTERESFRVLARQSLNATDDGGLRAPWEAWAPPEALWGIASEEALDHLAARTAEEMSSRLGTGERLAPAASVRLAEITGAPGDGNLAIGSALRAILRAQNIDVLSQDVPREAAPLTIEGRIAVLRDGGVDRIELLWRVVDSAGEEVGAVSQANEVPAGLLDPHWGENAYFAALGAAEGLAPLLLAADAVVPTGAVPLRPTAP